MICKEDLKNEHYHGRFINIKIMPDNWTAYFMLALFERIILTNYDTVLAR
jgi:hypothetical protein